MKTLVKDLGHCFARGAARVHKNLTDGPKIIIYSPADDSCNVHSPGSEVIVYGLASVEALRDLCVEILKADGEAT